VESGVVNSSGIGCTGMTGAALSFASISGKVVACHFFYDIF